MTDTPDSDNLGSPSNISKEDDVLPESVPEEGGQPIQMGKARTILISTMIVLTQLVQVG